MNLDSYLKKINCENFRDVNLENLKKIQSNHLKTFPFENLDMHMNKKINFSIEQSYDRLINESRGGYCLQLNTCFGWLLKQLGYDLYFTPSYIFYPIQKTYSRLPIHIILIVRLDNKNYYVDAGTVRIVFEPIEIKLNDLQSTPVGHFRFFKDTIDESYFILQRNPMNKKSNLAEHEWTNCIRFQLQPRELDYFKDMNEYVQTNEHPTIFYRTVCSKHIENGIITLHGCKFTEIKFGEDKDEIVNDKILSEDEVKDTIKTKFGIKIDESSFRPIDVLADHIHLLSR